MKKILFALVALLFNVGVHAQHGASASNMTLLGQDPLQARSAYQPVIYNQGGRWNEYVGHHGGRTVNALTGRQADNGTPNIEVRTQRAARQRSVAPDTLGSVRTC